MYRFRSFWEYLMWVDSVRPGPHTAFVDLVDNRTWTLTVTAQYAKPIEGFERRGLTFDADVSQAWKAVN